MAVTNLAAGGGGGALRNPLQSYCAASEASWGANKGTWTENYVRLPTYDKESLSNMIHIQYVARNDNFRRNG